MGGGDDGLVPPPIVLIAEKEKYGRKVALVLEVFSLAPLVPYTNNAYLVRALYVWKPRMHH